MRHVIMRHNISGTRNGEPWPQRGSGIDLPDVEAADMIAAGFAIAADPPVERATIPTARTARAGR